MHCRSLENKYDQTKPVEKKQLYHKTRRAQPEPHASCHAQAVLRQAARLQIWQQRCAKQRLPIQVPTSAYVGKQPHHPCQPQALAAGSALLLLTTSTQGSNVKLPVSRNIQHQHVDDLCWIPVVGLGRLLQNRPICIGKFQLDPGFRV